MLIKNAIVSGFPRSGTSAMMRLIQRIEVPIFSQSNAADEHNPLGYYECHSVMAMLNRNKDISTLLDALQGRAIKIPLPHSLKNLPFDRKYLIVWMERDPFLSAISLRKMNLDRGAKFQPPADQLAENIKKARSEAISYMQKHSSFFSVLRIEQSSLDSSEATVREFLSPLLATPVKSESEIHFAITKPLPSFRRQMQNAIHASNRFVRSGFQTTPTEILAEREATCRACPEWDAAALNATGRCRKCGCSTWAKLRMATERCPLGKWEAVEPLTARQEQRAE